MSYKYVLYKFDQKIDVSLNYNKLAEVVSADLKGQAQHVIELPFGSFKIFEKNGTQTLLTKRAMEDGDLVMFCDEDDCGDSVEYYRIEKVMM